MSESNFVRSLRRFIEIASGCLHRFYESRVASWLLITGFALVVSFLITVSLQYIPSNIQVGMITPRDIKADQNYEIVDEEASDKFKQEASVGVLPVYDFDGLIAESIAERVRLAFANTRIRYESAIDVKKPKVSGRDEVEFTGEEIEEFRRVFSDSLGTTPEPVQWKVLLDERFDERAENYLIRIIKNILDKPVIAERATLDSEGVGGIIVRRFVEGAEGASPQYDEAILKDVSGILSTDEVRDLIDKMEFPDEEFRNPSFAQKIRLLAKELVEPNFSYDRAETQKRRDEAAASVKNVIIKVNSGEMIIREGSRYEPWHLKVLTGIKKEKGRGLYSVRLFGTFILVFLFMTVPFYLAERLFRRVRPSRSDHTLMAVVGLSILVITRLSIMIAPAMKNAFFFSIPLAALYYAIPVAGGAMLLRMYLGAEITTVYAISISVLAGYLIEGDISFIAYYLIVNFAAVIAVTGADKRSSIIKAGIVAGIIGVVTILGGKLIAMATAAEPLPVSDILWCMLFSFISGIGCAIFTMIAAPIVESLSGYISDIKLLELANLNHPLLRELIVRAPGTYHHSHLVGVLGEAAAEAIGANSLLVRVGAYYHDIGKMKKPQYFIENAKAGDNKHEKLSPNMSALIVGAHVKDGLEMAEKAKLPKMIADMIPGHHGTRMMSFFYNKAKESEDPEMEKVDDKDFRYPGPKPRSIEEAILMLADVAEAAVRSLKEKSTARIQQTVQRSINDIFAESQLDECDLTLKDLNEIADAFIRILLGIYHQRIEYPKEENGKADINVVDETSKGKAVARESPSRSRH